MLIKKTINNLIIFCFYIYTYRYSNYAYRLWTNIILKYGNMI